MAKHSLYEPEHRISKPFGTKPYVVWWSHGDAYVVPPKCEPQFLRILIDCVGGIITATQESI